MVQYSGQWTACCFSADRSKKAFDTVDHNILCQKLEHYGLRGRELAWFKYYLSNRKQHCSINGVDSKLMDIDIGVPQG